MKKEFSNQLSDYINKVTEVSSLDQSIIEKVINTQIAILLGDLALSNKAETFVGELIVDNQDSVKFVVSDTIKEMVDGSINPLHVLMEILNGQ